jgi:hypothetical protein
MKALVSLAAVYVNTYLQLMGKTINKHFNFHGWVTDVRGFKEMYSASTTLKAFGERW